MYATRGRYRQQTTDVILLPPYEHDEVTTLSNRDNLELLRYLVAVLVVFTTSIALHSSSFLSQVFRRIQWPCYAIVQHGR
jgi:hypothetical protein